MLRTFYLQHLERSFHSPLIKVLMGIRRIGKTTLLQQIQEQFKRVNPVNINFELLENEELTEYHRLHTFLKEKIES
jgi:predicted AAA+ superfamily ATPase